MPVLEIDGLGKFEVDASFDSLSPEQQNAFVANMVKEATAGKKSSMPVQQPSGLAKVGQTADDLVRMLANGATFGQADRLAGWLGGKGFEAERKLSDEAKARTGIAGTVAEIGGSLAPSGLIAKGVGAGAAGVKSLVPFIANPFVQAGATGGIYGATDAALNDKAVLPTAAAGIGAGVAGQGLANVATGLLGKAAGVFNKKPEIPSAQQIASSKDAAYETAKQAGVVYTPQFVDRVTQEAQRKAADIGFSPRLQPGAKAVFEELGDRSGKNITMKDADILRRIASGGYEMGKKENNRVVRSVVETIDDAMRNPKPGDILAGNASVGVPALNEGRRLAAIDFKLQDIANAVTRAKNQAARSGSGGNIDNATRQKFDQLLQNRMNWTPDEQAALQKIVQGTMTQDAMRLAGKLSPSGNGLMAALSLGATAFNPLMALPAMGGLGAKFVADKATANNVKELEKIVRAGGLLSATQPTPNAVQRLAQSERDTLARLFMGLGLLGTPVASYQP